MRYILFRGKCLDNGEWIVGDLLRGSARFNPGKAYICPELYAGHTDSGSLLFGGFIEVDPKSVGEYIGLRDTRGSRIFEGDLIGSANGDNDPEGNPAIVAKMDFYAGFVSGRTVDGRGVNAHHTLIVNAASEDEAVVTGISCDKEDGVFCEQFSYSAYRQPCWFDSNLHSMKPRRIVR